LAQHVEYRTSKFLNNIIEADDGTLKRVIRPARGFQKMKVAYAAIKGFEVMRMIHHGRCVLLPLSATGKIRLVNRLFILAA
jgi:IS6 family transposase